MHAPLCYFAGQNMKKWFPGCSVLHMIRQSFQFIIPFYLTNQVPPSVFATASSEMEFKSAYLSSRSRTPQSQPRSIY